jgi:predicted ArsR family transcriptional regulator
LIRVFTDPRSLWSGHDPTVIGEMNGNGGDVHRALADPSRARIVDELQGEHDALDAQELSRRLGLHANTVRWHLGVLGDAGVVSAERAPRSTPGRPRTVYRLSPEATAADRDEFRLLASVLTTALASDPGAVAKAERAGRQWGRYLAPRRPPSSPLSDEEAVEEVVRLLDEQGFAPERVNGNIRLRRCPFLELAEQHPQVVCSVHRGLIAGALDELGTGLESELTPFVEPTVCVARLASRA